MADEETVESADLSPYAPGILIGVERSHHEPLEFSPEEQTSLKDLTAKLSQRDMPAYREQIVRTWEKRLFDRGFQHLLPLLRGGWQIPQIGSGYGPGETDSRSNFETNIYNSYIQILVSALTREFPKPSFDPNDPERGEDVTAANSAKRIIDYINRGASIMEKQAELARFLCIDGQALLFTRYMVDGQQFGYETAQEQEEETKPAPLEEEGTVPEDEQQEEENAADETAGGGEEEQGHETDTGTGGEGKAERAAGAPRGRQVTVVKGALETKLPIKAECLAQCGYAQVSEEIDVAIARARYRNAAQRISPSNGGPGGDDIDRLARINVKLGIMDNFVTSDSQEYDVTEQITWLRPAQLLELEPPQVRDSVLSKTMDAGDGLRVIFCGQVFCEARAISMDEQLTLIHALPGDGVHRPGFADWLMPIQKVVNNWMELIDMYATRGVSNKWMDNEMFNVNALRQQTNVPGSIHPFTRELGVEMSEVIWEETPLAWPEQLTEFVKFMILDLAQLLCGAVPALSGGGDASPTDTFGGMLVQRDQAIGRLGIPWRHMKEGLANSAAQAIRSFAQNNESPVRLTGSESVTIEMTQLTNGNFLAYPVTDENFPESPTQKANRLSLLIQDAVQNPYIGQLMDDPDNLEQVLNANGISMTVPVLEARDKQLGEFDVLLKSGPVPNPQIDILQAKLKQAQAFALQRAQAQQPIPPELVEATQQLQQQIAALPPEVSSVEIAYFDDHATELATCVKLLNSERGRELRDGDEGEQAAYQNIELHAKEHEAALAQKKAQQPPQGKPPSVSVSIPLKDLPPVEASEAVNMAGINAKPQDFVAQEAAEAAEKHPPAGGINITGVKPNGQS